MKLKISETLSVPVEAVTQTFADLGIRGSGKTNTGVVIAEEMLKAGDLRTAQLVVSTRDSVAANKETLFL